MQNVLYYGDNLDVLREHVKDETVDLVYLDPPFNSNATYNILFKERDGSDSAAQIEAFKDTWHWDERAERTFAEVMDAGGKVSELLRAIRQSLGTNDMFAYLTMMAPRLVELRRVLKDTGSVYLHCDPTASHYLKLLMDAVFGPRNFRNEIVWKRQSAHSDATRFGRVHDVLLFYGKSENATWSSTYQPYDTDYVEQYYRFRDPDGRRFMSGDLGAAGLQGGGYTYEWRGVTRLWRCPISTMQEYEKQGRIYYTKNGFPRLKRYLDESRGMPAQDVWADIESLRSWHAERLHYQTQKPEALLERIIRASTNEGHTVLDPFCGCGTTVAVAQKLNRCWIGIDITYRAIGLIRRRLKEAHEGEIDVAKTYTVVGIPTTIPDAQQLATEKPLQFQSWALDLVPGTSENPRKSRDRAIDGVAYFDKSGKRKRDGTIYFSVKSGGHVGVTDVRELASAVTRDDADIGVLISLHKPSPDAMKEAVEMGFFEAPWGGRFRKIQIITIAQLLQGKKIDFPMSITNTLKRAPKHVDLGHDQASLDF